MMRLGCRTCYVDNPGELPIAKIETIFYPLIPIGREVIQETAALNVLIMQGERLRAEVVNERSHLRKSHNQ